MDQINGTPGLLELVPFPAFSVKDGLVDWANGAARALLIAPGTPVDSLLAIGKDEYAAMESGCLSVTASINGQRFGAFVSRIAGQDIFLLDQEEDEPVQQALALAAVSLRDPLCQILNSAEALRQIPGVLTPEGAQKLNELNRGAFQLLRQVGNMSDAIPYAQETPYCRMMDAEEVIREIVEKAASLLEETGVRISYTGLRDGAIVPLNRDKLERALHNLLLNAAQSLDKDGKIDVALTRTRDRLYLAVTDNGSGIPDEIFSTLFYRYRRRPSLDSACTGIGLGLPLVRSVAVAHGGTVLVERCQPKGTRVTMTLAIPKYNEALLRAPAIQFDYAGEFDHALVEFSQLLPPSRYE